MESAQEYNGKIRRWGRGVLPLLKGNVSRMETSGKNGSLSRVSTHRTELKLADSLKVGYKKNYGEIDRVVYKFERHGVFFKLGVGRGYKSSGGSVTRTATGKLVKLRQPKNWFDSTINAKMPELINIVGNAKADQAVEATKIKVR